MNEQPVPPVLEPASSAATEPVAGAAHGDIPDLVHAQMLYQSGKYAAASRLREILKILQAASVAS